ncbi:MAG: hypothetical protein GY754_02440 [bacterium]|nr:hypothetical protein [bacterium]
MLQKLINYSVLFLLSSSLFFLTGCDSSGTVYCPNGSNTGTIKLAISQKNSTKTILPDIDMTPATYTITGTGPDAAEFARSITDDSAEIPELAFGNWIVTVDALNANNQVIARGSEAVTVHTGETATADITVTPLEGNGTLNVTLEWNNNDTEVPSIEAQLINSADVVQDLAFTINGEGNTGTYSNSALPAGYYVLSVKLLDNNIQTMGAVEIVRIVEGETSTGSFVFNEINKPGGSIIANIIADMQEPIEVAMTEIPDEIAKGSTTAVTASVPDGVGEVKYIWFINGDQKHIGSTADPVYTIPVDTLKTGGVYRIDVAAFSIDGKRGGSASDSFRVTGSTEKVWEGDYTIMTQAHIDALSGYTKITGNLEIGDIQASINGTTPTETFFTDLTGLECLTHIEGYLAIVNNNALTSLTGLNNLTAVDGGGLEVGEDTFFAGIHVAYNALLTNIDEFNNITSLDGILSIVDNESLVNLDGFANLTTVGETLEINDNISLTNLAGLSNLTSIGKTLIIMRSSFTTLNSFNNLTSIGESIAIADNSMLTNIEGFNSLTSIGVTLYLKGNTGLAAIQGFSSLTHVGDNLTIIENNMLANIGGFNSLTHVGDTLTIRNSLVTTIGGFNNLCSVKNVAIRFNSELCSVEAELIKDRLQSCLDDGVETNNVIEYNKICP